MARGAAYADFDHDGDLDLLISHQSRSCVPVTAMMAAIGIIGSLCAWPARRSNRDGIGAVVRVQTASGKQWNMVRSGSSYCSQSDLALTFGLGNATAATVEVEWPSGTRQSRNVPADQFLRVDETGGITSRQGPASR